MDLKSLSHFPLLAGLLAILNLLALGANGASNSQQAI
jgi:hypothetical protein